MTVFCVAWGLFFLCLRRLGIVRVVWLAGCISNDESKILYPPAKQLSDIIKYKATSVDLNDDGVNEVVAYTEGSLVCGSGGCTSYILQEINSDWKIIGEIFPGHFFETNKNHTNGFLNIYFNDNLDHLVTT